MRVGTGKWWLVNILCEINDNAPRFCLVLSDAHLPSEKPNMKSFVKIVNV